MRSFVAAIAFVIPIALQAQEPSKLDSFTFEGVSLSTSLNDFRQRHPAAQHIPDNSEAANGLQAYMLVQTKSANGAMFTFFENKLYQVQVIYNAETINKMGAVKMYEKVTSAFGSPNDTQSNDNVMKFTWNKNNRLAECVITNKNALVSVKDIDSENRLNDRRAKGATLGF